MPGFVHKTRVFLGLVLFSLAAGCSFIGTPPSKATAPLRSSLSMMALVNGQNAERERSLLTPFVNGLGFQFRYLPSFESDNRLKYYRQLLQVHSPQPDLLEFDIIWPGPLAPDLVDLKPRFGEQTSEVGAEALAAFTVENRLVAIPIYTDTGVLYYRSDLLRKYGRTRPPQTWDELEEMASVIQAGERRAGDREFWGFVWPGGPFEALTCNALEWFGSQGAGQIIRADHTIHARNPRALRALDRAAGWIGTITPKGVVGYGEDDAINLWRSGHAAFLRSWSYARSSVAPSIDLQKRCGITDVPGGYAGKVRTLGGAGIGVSRYSEHPEAALSAVKHLVHDVSLRDQKNIAETATLRGTAPDELLFQESALTGTPITRPSTLTGQSYDDVSRACFTAFHSVLAKQRSSSESMADLEGQLVRITGFRAVRD